jgi:hypothetical protein
VSGGPTTYSLNPGLDFTQGESCTVTVNAANVTDNDTNDPPDAMTSNYQFTFTVDEAPSVTSTTPTNGATGVALNANISITFSEPVHGLGSSGALTISCGTSGTHTAAITGGPTTFTVNPDSDFVGNELCTVTIDAASILDNDTADPPSSMLANYVFSFTTVNPLVTTTTTASNETATYGDASVTLHATVSPNTANVGTVTFTVKDGATTVGTAGPASVTAGAASASFSLSGVGAGTYTIEASYSGGTGYAPSNNSAQSPAPTLTVDPVELTVTPDPQSVTYGDAAPGTSFYTFSVTGFITGENEGNASGYVDPTCTSDYVQGDHVADSPKTITCSGGSADNYTFDTTATADLTINPAELTVTPDAQSVTYGDAAPASSFYTFNVTGFVLTEDETTASGYVGPTCTSDYVQGDHVADSPKTISCSGGSADDYTFDTSVTADLTIEKLELTAVFTVANKYFDNTTNATILTESATGQYGTDVCTLSGGTTAFPSSAVGSYNLTLTGWSLVGANCGDYQISSDPTTTASILAWDAAGHGFYAPVGVANSVFTPAPGSTPTTPSGLAWNTAKGGSTIPLKFQVFAGTTELTDTSTPYPITSFNATKMSNCGSDATASDAVEFTTTGGTSLRYDATAHQWIQNWKTPTVNSETCYRAWVTFADGSTLEAFFKLKK